MTSPHQFANLPRTIFDDNVDATDLDVSEEMEEIRELLYELIKTNFTSGVMVEHLAKIYKESYENAGLGPTLPDNWLDHIRAAEEFEVVNRGPIVMLYTRQRGFTPTVIDASPTNPLNITKGALLTSKFKSVARMRLTDRELAQQMKSILVFEPIVCPCTSSVVVARCTDDMRNICVQLAGARSNFELLRSAMDAHYNNNDCDTNAQPITQPETGGVYALKHIDQHWYRALFKSSDTFYLLDVGDTVPSIDATIRRLRAEYALPRIYPIYAFTVSLADDAQTRSSLRIFRTACHTLLPLALRFLSEYIENGETKFRVQCSSVAVTDRREQDQKVIKVLPAVPNYSMTPTENVELVAMELCHMPKNQFDAYVLAVFDPDNIIIRQCSLDPIPDYIASAVKRDAMAQASPPAFAELIPGRFFAAKLHEFAAWERVQLLGVSTVDADCFRVHAVDLGIHGVARKANIRHLRIPFGLRKIMMAKCKVAGIAPLNGDGRWNGEDQAKFRELLKEVNRIQVIPLEDWDLIAETGCTPVPSICARVLINGQDLAEIMIGQGCARAVQP